MEVFFTAGFALLIVIVTRRNEILKFRWEPTRETWIALGTGLLAILFSAAMLLFSQNAWPAKALHYLGIYLLCGVLLPWGATFFLERQSFAAMGIHKQRLKASLLITLVLSMLFGLLLVFQGDFSGLGVMDGFKALVVLTGAGGLFELFLYYSFMHLRLEKAFGILPAILVTSTLYVFWHIGTQFTLEPDIPAAILKLFAVGVMYQSVFSLTKNVLVIWPFFHAVGVMIDFSVNIGALSDILPDFGWSVVTLVMMAVSMALMVLISRRRHTLNEYTATISPTR